VAAWVAGCAVAWAVAVGIEKKFIRQMKEN